MPRFNRGKNFVRATEVRPFTNEHKAAFVQCKKSMLNQIEILHDSQPSNTMERVKIVEKMYKFIMDYPEMLARHVKFRNLVNSKIDEISKQMRDKNLHESIVLKDARYYMKMLSVREDYVHESVDTFVTPCNVTHIKNNSYNLRPRTKHMKFVV